MSSDPVDQKPVPRIPVVGPDMECCEVDFRDVVVPQEILRRKSSMENKTAQ
jgi:hypothetical protein